MMKIVTVPPRAINYPSPLSLAEAQAADIRIDRVPISQNGGEQVIAARRQRRQRDDKTSVRLPLRGSGGGGLAVFSDDDVAGDGTDRVRLAQRVSLERHADDAAVALLLDRDLDVGRHENAVADMLDPGDRRLRRVGKI